MEQDYSKRELDQHFADIKEQLNRIEAQTVRTNGRVTKLENWRSYLTGGLTIIGMLTTLGVFKIFNQ